jgi:hypothetical protein
MSGLIVSSSSAAPLPLPRVDVTIRPGVLSDVPFLDSLQKLHTKQVGWMPTKQLEGKVLAGQVLVAETRETRETQNDERRTMNEDAGASQFIVHRSSFCVPTPVGYLIGADQYFKRDDVGIIYQINVVPEMRRSLVAATLLKAQFERSAYGCKLYCCWCAQDIEANKFWEAMGFVPLAFRAGSRGKGRVHIFWQRRIRAGDTTTPYWFPAQTSAGSIREDRLVFPIPPGMHWRDAMPIVLPGVSVLPGMRGDGSQRPALPGEGPPRASRKPAAEKPAKPAAKALRGFAFAPPVDATVKPEKPERAPRPKAKNDPRLVAAARELRDRWLEHVHADSSALVPQGKYEVSRALSDTRMAVTACSAPLALPSSIAA